MKAKIIIMLCGIGIILLAIGLRLAKKLPVSIFHEAGFMALMAFLIFLVVLIYRKKIQGSWNG